MAESNMMADRDEEFNTRYGSFRGWQMAIERVIPIPRHTARLNLSKMLDENGVENTSEAVDYLLARFMRVQPASSTRSMLINFLDEDLGTTSITEAQSYMEDSLRLVLHLIMSQPEFQLG